MKTNPQIKFLSKKAEFLSDKKLKVTGDLTILEKTKSIVLDVDFVGEANAYEIKRVVFKAKISFKREDFGLTWNDIVESGPVVGSEVEITLTIQAKRKTDL